LFIFSAEGPRLLQMWELSCTTDTKGKKRRLTKRRGEERRGGERRGEEGRGEERRGE